MNNLLLLQGAEAFWVSRSASVPDHDVWRGQPTENVAKAFAPIYASGLDPLNAAADLCERTPRGRFKSRDSLTVLLGYPYVQHLVLPWKSGLHQAEDWQHYAQTQFDQQYGKDHQWQIVIDPAAAGQPRLAAATNIALIQGLQLLA
ncbi:MAG: hypothetical protein NWQ13_05165, partial [Glaciimonas sp.]|nr:hypothetical protein [Glaciimonas sp.]